MSNICTWHFPVFFQIGSVQSLSHVRLFAIPWTAECQASLSINYQGLLKLMSMCPLSRWWHPTISSNHLILCCSLLLPPSIFPSIKVFSNEKTFTGRLVLHIQFFASGGQSIGLSASASGLPMNIQYWFLLGLSGWISLQCRRLSRVFSHTTVQKHQFFGALLSL